MAREDCALCKGTGWKLVPRKDGAAGQMAVVCECGMEERAEKVMERARVPNATSIAISKATQPTLPMARLGPRNMNKR